MLPLVGTCRISEKELAAAFHCGYDCYSDSKTNPYKDMGANVILIEAWARGFEAARRDTYPHRVGRRSTARR